MAEKTLEDVIKALKANHLDQMGRVDQNYAATLSVAQEVASLTTLLKKHFVAQKAAEGDRLEAARERKVVGIDRSTTNVNNSRAIGANNQMNFGGIGGAFAGLGVGMGAAGAGLGAFFIGLAGAESIMAKFGAGDNLRNLMVNLGEGLQAFGNRELLALGALFAGSALFTAMPGLGGGDIVVGLGAVGIGIGGFFAGLGLGDAALKFLDVDGVKLKNMMKNVAEGLGAFSNDQLKQLSGLFAGSALFAAIGGVTIAGKAATGLGLVGLGIGGFFAGLGLADAGLNVLDVDGGKLKTLMENVAAGLGAFDKDILNSLEGAMATGAIFGALPGGMLIAGKAAVGMTAIGAGIGGFLSGIAGAGDFAAVIGVDGSGFKKLATNIAEGLAPFNDIDGENILAKVGALAGIGPAMLGAVIGGATSDAIDATIETATKVFNFLFGTDIESNQDDRRRNRIQKLVDSTKPLGDLDMEGVKNLDLTSQALDRFVTTLDKVGDIDTDMATTSIGKIAGFTSNISGLLNAMAHGGTYTHQRPMAIDHDYEFPDGGIMNMSVPLDQLEARMKQINGIIAQTNMNRPAINAPQVVPQSEGGAAVMQMDASDRRLIQMATERNAIVAAETSATDLINSTY